MSDSSSEACKQEIQIQILNELDDGLLNFNKKPADHDWELLISDSSGDEEVIAMQ